MNKLTWEFDFSEISKRRFGRSYIEQTSFDANGRNGDFFNPVGVLKKGLVLFEDFGPGIFERLLCFHRSTDYNRKYDMDYVTFEVVYFTIILPTAYISELKVVFHSKFPIFAIFSNIHKASPNTDHNIICMFLKRKTISKPEKSSLSYTNLGKTTISSIQRRV